MKYCPCCNHSTRLLSDIANDNSTDSDKTLAISNQKKLREQRKAFKKPKPDIDSGCVFFGTNFIVSVFYIIPIIVYLYSSYKNLSIILMFCGGLFLYFFYYAAKHDGYISKEYDNFYKTLRYCNVCNIIHDNARNYDKTTYGIKNAIENLLEKNNINAQDFSLLPKTRSDILAIFIIIIGFTIPILCFDFDILKETSYTIREMPTKEFAGMMLIILFPFCFALYVVYTGESVA